MGKTVTVDARQASIALQTLLCRIESTERRLTRVVKSTERRLNAQH